ncbi:MAG: TAXI family TRAP transporter solute-binding subunit [Rhodospirillales bacterium]
MKQTAKKILTIAVIGGGMLWYSPAQTAPKGIGTNPQGSLGYAIASALAKTITEKGGIDTRAVGMGGSSVFIPQVNSGEMAFSTSNTFEAIFATQGTGYFSGHPNPNIRVVAALVPFTVGIMVRNSSDIKKLTDLKGKRFPSRYSSMKLVGSIQRAIFNAVGMNPNSVKGVAVPNFVKGAELLVEGKVVGVLLAPGSGITKKTNAQVPIRFLNVPNTAATRASLSRDLPSTSIVLVKPGKRATGIHKPTNLVGYQYALITYAKMSNDIAYKAAKAIAENKKSLSQSHGIFRSFKPQKMVLTMPGATYHPGAIKYYKERGWWPAK